MVKTLKVILWDEEVGRLSWDDKRQMSYFTYNPTFVHRGIDISPLWASIRNNRGLMSIPWLHLLNAYLLNERRLRFYQRNLLPCSRS